MRRIIVAVITPAQATRIAIVAVVGAIPAIRVGVVYTSVAAYIAGVIIVVGIAVQAEITCRLICHRVAFSATYNYAAGVGIIVAVPVVVTAKVWVKCVNCPGIVIAICIRHSNSITAVKSTTIAAIN